MNYLMVDLYKEFKCVADACPNTCCEGWNIFMDKETCGKMEEKEEQLGIPAKEWIDNDGEVSFVRLDHGRCPMLTENNLCRVVLKLGPEYLGLVCASYPRENRWYGETIEGHLHMSCPEVVLKLMEKETVEFDAGQDQQPAPKYPHTQLYVFESAVRAAIVNVLQSMPHISLNTRLFAAFTILEEGIRMYQADQLDGDVLEREIAYYVREPVLRGLEVQLSQAVNGNSQYQLLGKILKVIEDYAKEESARFLKLVQQAEQYFKENGPEQYLPDVKAFKEECLAKYSGFYTNYWVYRIFSDTLSIPDYEESKEKFIYISAEFALFQTIALASFAQKGRLDQEEYIYIISCVSRLAEHVVEFHRGLTKQIHEKNLATAAGILLMTII